MLKFRGTRRTKFSRNLIRLQVAEQFASCDCCIPYTSASSNNAWASSAPLFGTTKSFSAILGEPWDIYTRRSLCRPSDESWNWTVTLSPGRNRETFTHPIIPLQWEPRNHRRCNFPPDSGRILLVLRKYVSGQITLLIVNGKNFDGDVKMRYR